MLWRRKTSRCCVRGTLWSLRERFWSTTCAECKFDKRLPACSPAASPKPPRKRSRSSWSPCSCLSSSKSPRSPSRSSPGPKHPDPGRYHYPHTKLLRQVKGVGPITSLTFVLTLGEAQRFSKSRTVGAFLGAGSRKKAVRSLRSQRRMTKQGDSAMRRLLVNAARYILGPFGPDCDLRRFGQKVSSRGAKLRQEESHRRRRTQAGCLAPSPLAYRRGLRASPSRTSQGHGHLHLKPIS